MKERKLSFLCLSMSVVCVFPTLLILLLALNRQAGSTLNGSLMECSTPTLIFGVALIIYFIHKARAA